MKTERCTGVIVSSDRDRYLILPDREGSRSDWRDRVWVPKADCRVIGYRPGLTKYYPAIQVVSYSIGPLIVG
jgi:hypothetical protein